MPNITKVSEIMSKHVFYVDVEDTVRKAEDIMKDEQVNQLPVLEGAKIIGMITDRKVMEYTLREIYDSGQTYGEAGFNKIIDYEKIMLPITHVVYPEDSIAKAIKLMAKYKLNCVPVVDWEMNLIGLLTYTDVLLFMHNYLSEI